MTKPDFQTFEKAVTQSFAPWAKGLKLDLQRLSPGIYEIAGTGFITRVRLEVGHGQTVLVTLMKAEDCAKDVADSSQEIGLGVLARFRGQEILTEQTDSPQKLTEQADYLAKKASELVTPYLLGLRDDFEALREYVQTLIVQSGMREKKWNFPKNVREEWT